MRREQTYVNFVPDHVKRNSPYPEELNKLPQTLEAFEEVLKDLRPRVKDVKIKVARTGKEGREVVFTIIQNGKLIEKKKLNIDPDVQEQHIEEEIDLTSEELLKQFSRPINPLWPGCRGAIARHFGVKIEYHFNRWFDKHANALRDAKH